MIEESLKSKFVQLNFFMHNLAQLKFSSHSDGDLLSFIPTTYSLATDGRIINIEIFDYQKRYHPEKHYVRCLTQIMHNTLQVYCQLFLFFCVIIHWLHGYDADANVMWSNLMLFNVTLRKRN